MFSLSHLGHLLLPLSGLLVALSPVFVSADDFSDNYDAYNNADYGKRPTQRFVSNPDILAPLIQVNLWNEEKISPTGGSHIFLRHDYEESSPLILDAADLTLVYMDRSYDRTSDVRVQTINNQAYLTFYAGAIVDGHGNGDGLAFNSHYEEAYRVNVHNLSVKNDLHEFQFTDDGTALITAYDLVPMNLRPYRGSSRGALLDGVFQEVDIATNEVLFEWRASEHVDLHDSYYKVEHKWDFFHINSIQKSRDGNYLVSARHMHSIYLINSKTGEIMWTLGGKKNQFTELDAGDASQSGDSLLSFAWQHHARFLPDTEDEITFFDNHALTTKQQCEKDCSRGVHVRFDFANPETPTVQLLHEFRHPQSLQAQSQGSVQPLNDGTGNVFVGWGRCPSFTEHTADGEAVMDVQFSPWHTSHNSEALDNYRAYRMNWKAEPITIPDVMTQTKDGVLSLYASWNGATEVKAWAFLASNESSDLYGPGQVQEIIPRSGFETSLALAYPAKFARVAALDANWNILGSSGIVDIRRGRVFDELRPIAAVLKVPDVLISDAGYEVSSSFVDEHAKEFPGQGGKLFGIPIGWHTLLGVGMLVGLVLAVRKL
ncbi:ASST-domain-containing protein [Coniella lustricola]|uniref:ASST-domain-containing protein n=1 Tax=Coniella lustricola TaxID=2025994 RepID=A0A2T3AAE3_9PEZI|nr:ASST-domain-containing protein [Coniella lustricola]